MTRKVVQVVDHSTTDSGRRKSRKRARAGNKVSASRPSPRPSFSLTAVPLAGIGQGISRGSDGGRRCGRRGLSARVPRRHRFRCDTQCRAAPQGHSSAPPLLPPGAKGLNRRTKKEMEEERLLALGMKVRGAAHASCGPIRSLTESRGPTAGQAAERATAYSAGQAKSDAGAPWALRGQGARQRRGSVCQRAQALCRGGRGAQGSRRIAAAAAGWLLPWPGALLERRVPRAWRRRAAGHVDPGTAEVGARRRACTHVRPRALSAVPLQATLKLSPRLPAGCAPSARRGTALRSTASRARSACARPAAKQRPGTAACAAPAQTVPGRRTGGKWGPQAGGKSSPRAQCAPQPTWPPPSHGPAWGTVAPARRPRTPALGWPPHPGRRTGEPLRPGKRGGGVRTVRRPRLPSSFTQEARMV